MSEPTEKQPRTVRYKRTFKLDAAGRLYRNDGAIFEPPAAPEERLKMQVAYAETRYKQAADTLRDVTAAEAAGGGEWRWNPAELGTVPAARDRFGKPDLAAVRQRLELIAGTRKLKPAALRHALEQTPGWRRAHGLDDATRAAAQQHAAQQSATYQARQRRTEAPAAVGFATPPAPTPSPSPRKVRSP